MDNCCTQFGYEIAGTLTRRFDSSPCSDRGQNVVCYAFKYHQGKAAKGIGWEEEVSPTLIADFHNPAVVISHG